MRSVLLDRIVRQKDPELLKAVEYLSKNETETGVRMLQQQGRVTEIPDSGQRISTIAKSYAAHPENTIIVSPDNASRRALNQRVRRELQAARTPRKARPLPARTHPTLRHDGRGPGLGCPVRRG